MRLYDRLKCRFLSKLLENFIGERYFNIRINNNDGHSKLMIFDDSFWDGSKI